MLTRSDLNYLEDSGGCADVPIALLPASETVTTLQMDAKLNLDQFEKVCDVRSTPADSHRP